jgi:hypothetical protein
MWHLKLMNKLSKPAMTQAVDSLTNEDILHTFKRPADRVYSSPSHPKPPPHPTL